MQNHEQEEGTDKIDQAQAFLGGILGAAGGIPLFYVAVVGGYLLGSRGGEIIFAMIAAWFDLFWGWSAFLVVPIVATCFLLMLYSEIPRVSIAAVVFMTSAWSAFAHDTPRDWKRAAAIAVVSVVLYLFAIHPLVLDYRRGRQ